ncbi:MAG: sulfotransferase [Planctomycetes bacterium]|nr:sulfotransferase [Planctomycetota bacterium]
MIYLVAAIVGIFTGEILRRIVRMRIHSRMAATARKSFALIRRYRVSDHWKERVLLQYSCRMFLNTLHLAFWFGVVVGFVAAAIWVATLFDIQFLHFLLTPFGIIYVTAVAAVYLYLRALLVKPNQNYSFFSQCLHRFALSNRSIAEASFNIEQLTQKPLPSSKVIHARHVFVSGLARAGTTVLMRWLYSTGAFCSLTYRDMPFVLMPGLWRTMTSLSQQKSVKQERAHGDGLLVDYDSPEALEEVFWKVFEGEHYIHSDKLTPMTATEETTDKFRAYIAAILKSSAKPEIFRYLSKNNNNILRLPSLCAAFPNAIIIIPFRNPLQQANSQLLQHRLFIAKHEEDPFSNNYMTWLAHHEFGSTHKRFRFSENSLTFTDPGTLNYWLELWLETYSWLNENRPQGAFLLSYDLLCEDFGKVWPRVAQKIGIRSDLPLTDPVGIKKRMLHEEADNVLLQKAEQLYVSLRSQMEADF